MAVLNTTQPITGMDPQPYQPGLSGLTGGGGQTVTGSTGQLGKFTADMTPDQVRALVNQYNASAGLTNTDNGDYWVNAWNQFGKNDPDYFMTRLVNGIATNGGNTQPFQGMGIDFGGTSAGASGAGGGASGAGLGSLWNSLPTEQQAMNMPGIQFALGEANRALQAGAAAKGTLLNGRVQQGIGESLIGSALSQGYLPLAQLQLGYNQANVGNLQGLAGLGLNATGMGQ